MSLFDEPGVGPSVCRLLVAYDGTAFRGFATQAEHRTVESALTKALEKVLRIDVDLAVAGRTDAGVHAWGQVVSFPATPGLDPDRLRGSLNSLLAPELVVRAAELVPAGFEARRSATSRTYRYTVLNRDTPDPFLARYAWWVPEPLDLAVMRLASDPFVGLHDFTSFCRKRKDPTKDSPAPMRRVLQSGWDELDDGVLRYEVRASAFCWQMVRSIVGTLVDCGLGKRRAGDIMQMLATRDRGVIGQVAPAHGLCLWDVSYESSS